jgi:hypothetical protein
MKIGEESPSQFEMTFDEVGVLAGTCLIEAAKAAPGQFETAAYEELLGGNLDEPLSPAGSGARHRSNNLTASAAAE